jgi:outer membrane PBP1 activator LpoA protein
MNNPLIKYGLKFALLYGFVLLPGLPFFSACALATAAAVQSAENAAAAAATKPLDINDNAPSVSELYQVPAPTVPPEQQRLGTIDALIKSGDYAKAKEEADKINPSTLSGQEASQLNLLYAQISLSVGEAELSIENLKKIQAHSLSTEQKINYRQAQAFAFSLTGQTLDSAKARIDLSLLLTDPEAQDQNQLAILEALSLLPDEELKNSVQPETGSLAGWIALARLNKLKKQPDFNAQLRQWRTAFPDHPADTSLLFKHIQTTGNSLHYPGSIAVILPGSGPFAAAGKAVKAGIMAAFDNLDNKGFKPNLHFYDSEQDTPAELYHQSIAAGAELIIGPLDKKDIQHLADSVTLEIPILALNHIQNLEQDNLYQFALSPMDDVEQITGKARQDGHKKALLLIPENPQTERIADYFEEYWQSGNSAIVKTQTYHLKETDFSSPVGKLLNRNESKPIVSEELGSVNPGGEINADLSSEKPSPEGEGVNSESKLDADAIFISAYNPEARAIKQQLNAHGAGGLAVYALPNAYSGQDNPVQDQILDTLVFCDMPWLFDKAYQGNLSLRSLSTIRRQFPDSYLRLVAMGIDAFNLSARLNELISHPYQGATGKLSLAEDNRIKRELVCAKFIGGKPEISVFINRGDASVEKAMLAPAGEENAPEQQPQ